MEDQEIPQHVGADLRRGRASFRRLNLVNHTSLYAAGTAQTERHPGLATYLRSLVEPSLPERYSRTCSFVKWEIARLRSFHLASCG